jgi:hypothetical protein
MTHQLAELYLAAHPVTRADGQWLRYDTPLSREELDLSLLRFIKKARGMTAAQRVAGHEIKSLRCEVQALLEPELADLVRAFARLPGAAEGLTAAETLKLLHLAPDARTMGQMLSRTRGLIVDGLTIRMEAPEVGPRLWRLGEAAEAQARRLDPCC